jgi:hypothetical protein
MFRESHGQVASFDHVTFERKTTKNMGKTSDMANMANIAKVCASCAEITQKTSRKLKVLQTAAPQRQRQSFFPRIC